MTPKDKKTSLLESFRSPPPQVIQEFHCGRAGIELLDNGAFFYSLDGNRVTWAHSRAKTIDGRTIDTRTATQRHIEYIEEGTFLGNGKTVTRQVAENGLLLEQKLTLFEDRPFLCIQLLLIDQTRRTETRFLAPIDTPYPDRSGNPLFLSLDQKMLLVPYDNDMWVRYESVPPRPGRTSYDITAIYDETSRSGLVIGALDFNPWKNAITWSAHDARSFTAYCGASDASTHDIQPHGVVSGDTVASSRFFCGWYGDIRSGLEEYGKTCAAITPCMPWNGNVVFGWNSFSGLGLSLTLPHWQEAGDFMKDELPGYRDEAGVTYPNLDAAFGLDHGEIKEMVKGFHDRGQKAGWYAAPFVAHPRMAGFPLKGSDLPVSSLYLKDSQGRPFPPVDGLFPLDSTHPLWEVHTRATLKEIVDLGFDYIKLDFLSHGSLEGSFYDSRVTTGRMALDRAYKIIADELSVEKTGRELFVSLSIAPLFPHGLGTSRRCCCDSFGHHDDTRYVLNALNFAWWTSGTLYQYNDPDHITLYNSVIDGRGPTTLPEARSRYNAAAISGTVMMLSDNFGPEGDPGIIQNSRQRAIELANNPRINEVARLGKAFVPVELKDGTVPFYTLHHQGRYFLAMFNFLPEDNILVLDAARAGLPESGKALDLNRDQEILYRGKIRCELAAYDSAIFEIIEQV